MEELGSASQSEVEPEVAEPAKSSDSGQPTRTEAPVRVDGPSVGMAYPPIPKSFIGGAPIGGALKKLSPLKPPLKEEPPAKSPVKKVQSEINSLRHKLATLEAEVPAAAAQERRLAEDAAVASRAREERPPSSEESAPAPTESGSSARESGSTRSSHRRRHKASRERQRSEFASERASWRSEFAAAQDQLKIEQGRSRALEVQLL